MVGGGRGLAGRTYLTPSSGGFLTLNISLAKLQQLNITSALRVVVHVIPVICEIRGDDVYAAQHAAVYISRLQTDLTPRR